VIHERAGSRALAAVRVAVFGLWALLVALDPIADLAGLPLDSGEPVGFLRLVPRALLQLLLARPVLFALKGATLSCLLLAAAGAPRYRVWAAGATVLLVVHQMLERSVGDFAHDVLLLLYAVFVLALFPAADALTLPRRAPPREPSAPIYGAALFSLALIVTVAYAGIAAHRLAAGFPRIFTGPALDAWLGRQLGASPTGLPLNEFILSHRWARLGLRAGFFVTTLFELATPVALISRRFRWPWVAAMVLFHVAAGITLGLFFWPDLVVIALVFVEGDDWRRLARALGRVRPAPAG